MRINGFSWENFRNLAPGSLAPDPETNVIFGQNAQGKTNLLEGLWLFTGAKSFRGAKDAELVQFETERAALRLSFSGSAGAQTAQLQIAGRRSASLDGKKLSTPAALAGHFRAIEFSPADLSLVQDGPSVRRRFLDLAIGQLFPAYIPLLRDYHRALTQRGSVLRDARDTANADDLLDVFERELTAAGAKLIQYRRRYLELLNQSLPEIYHGLSGERETLTAEYQAGCKPEELGERMRAARKTDLLTGTTSVGPHRDDLHFAIDGLSARSYGSQGQQRSVALAAKLAEAEVLRSRTGENPVALLDDVMSELDPQRQDYVLNHIRGWQVFLTCCDPSGLDRLAKGAIYEMKDGRLSPAEKKSVENP